MAEVYYREAIVDALFWGEEFWSVTDERSCQSSGGVGPGSPRLPVAGEFRLFTEETKGPRIFLPGPLCYVIHHLPCAQTIRIAAVIISNSSTSHHLLLVFSFWLIV